MKATLTNNNIHIQDSYTMTDKNEMKNYLEYLKTNNPGNQVFEKRSIPGMISEWRAHNLFWKLGIMRDHTADVDLDYPQIWWHKIVWKILGI